MGDITIRYEERAEQATNPAAKRLFELMAEKQSNLALANDEVDQARFLELSDKLGPEIAVLKTHIDTLRDFSPEVTKKLLELSKKHNFMIFEDRKFADIGSTVKLQYSEGVYRIADWANIVNAHVVPGPGVIEGLGSVMKEKKDGMPRGVVILAQMSSEGSLAVGEYTKQAVQMANAAKDLIVGYIGNADPSQLKELVSIGSTEHILMTPGVQIQSKGDSLGQKYTLPEEAVMAGSDCIIVGRGIYRAEDTVASAKEYRKRGWDAYLKRTGQ